MGLTARKIGIAAMAFAAAMNVSPANDFSMAALAQAQTLPTLANMNACATPQEIVDRANNEGQFIVVTADQQVVVGSGVATLKNIFTSNERFTKGYHFVPEKIGSDAKFCKGQTYSDIRILDARAGQIDSRTVMPTKMENVKGSLSNALMNGSRAGENPVLQYTTSFLSTGEKARVTIAGKIGGTGVFLAADDAGMVVDATAYSKVNYTNSGQDLLKRVSSVELAALNR